MHGMGDGIALLFPGTTTKPFAGFPDGRQIRFREEDLDLLVREIPDIAAISPEYMQRNTPARLGRSSTVPAVTGIYPVYGDLRNIITEAGGRFINEPDLELRRRVAVLGTEIKKLLFLDDEAVGKQFYLGNTPFTVVGVMKDKTQNSSYYARDKDRIFIPASTHTGLFGDKYVDNFVYQPADPELSEAVEEQIYATLGRAKRFDPTDEDALGVWDTNMMDQFFKFFFIGFNMFMTIIGSFTLAVGGIGVANIMYVVVRERILEIGIKRSVGARRRDILRQFFLETFMIVGVGAGLGFLLAWLIIYGLSFLPFEEVVGTPRLSPMVAGITMGLLSIIAFLAGLFPARKAANLDPVHCLRG
jgi:putative ABC transport system permease protein